MVLVYEIGELLCFIEALSPSYIGGYAELETASFAQVYEPQGFDRAELNRRAFGKFRGEETTILKTFIPITHNGLGERCRKVAGGIQNRKIFLGTAKT